MYTKEESINILKEAIKLCEEYPNATYSSTDEHGGCSYTQGLVKNGPDKCGCIFGQAIHRLNYQYPRTDDKICYFVDDFVQSECQKIQNLQDCGYNWGCALSSLKITFPDYKEKLQ